MVSDPKVNEILKKYESKLKGRIKTDISDYDPNPDFSREYQIFRKEALSKRVSFYENLCNISEKIIKIAPSKDEIDKLKISIETIHLQITPVGASSFASILGFFIVILGVLYGIISYLNDSGIILPLIIILFGVFIVKPLTKIPTYIATRWRLKASNQMVLCILYIVMYMRHTSNLEHAIKFSAAHIKPPLSLDLRKIFWDVETERFTTIKESLDHYLEGWREWNLEFVDSFHLIEGSLYEPTEGRRIEILDKSLNLILEGTYEKMMHYAQELKNPITMLHMLGVVLPILGLVMFPLIGSFLGGSVKWWHLALLYNIFLPIIVYSVGINVLSKRPTGYGESEFEFKRKVVPLSIAIIIIIFFSIIGFTPLIIHLINPEFDFVFLGGKFFDYKCDSSSCTGPYGTGALLLSLFIPLGLALGFSAYYKLRTKNLIKLRDETKKLEKEFSGSLFQLGNRIGDGIPAELAFENVAENMRGTPSGNFFSLVSTNIRNLGMSIEKAIFNLKNGAILLYPSALIESSMEVLVESARKGPRVVAVSLISISNYVSQIYRINERLKDLLSEIVGSMKSQISFLAPVIAGIVVGIASMIVNIIGKLGDMLSIASTEGTTDSLGNLGTVGLFFNIKETIPSYYFQLIVGIYVFEIIIILTILANSVENGVDKLNEEHLISNNLKRSVLLYTLVALLVILIFNVLAGAVLTITQF